MKTEISIQERIIDMSEMKPGDMGVIRASPTSSYSGLLVGCYEASDSTGSANFVVSIGDSGIYWMLNRGPIHNKVTILPVGTVITITI